jgi:hypothetical protein
MTNALQNEVEMEEDYIDDMDVYDSMRALLADGIDLDDRAAVERVLINPHKADPATSKRYINWCIRAAKANQAEGGLRDIVVRGVCIGGAGFVPAENDKSVEA